MARAVVEIRALLQFCHEPSDLDPYALIDLSCQQWFGFTDDHLPDPIAANGLMPHRLLTVTVPTDSPAAHLALAAAFSPTKQHPMQL